MSRAQQRGGRRTKHGVQGGGVAYVKQTDYVLVADLSEHVNLPHDLAHHRTRATVRSMKRLVHLDRQTRGHVSVTGPAHGRRLALRRPANLSRDDLAVRALAKLRPEGKQRQQMLAWVGLRRR